MFKTTIALTPIFTVLYILTERFLPPDVQNQLSFDGDTDTDFNETENDESADVIPDITDGILIRFTRIKCTVELLLLPKK